MQGKETSGKRTKGKLTIMPSSTSRLSYISSSSHLCPSISSLFSYVSFFSSPSSSFFSSSFSFSSSYSSFSSSFRKFGKPPGSLSSPAGTYRTGTGMSAYRSCLLLPPGSKITMGPRLFTGYKILTGFTGVTRHWCSDCLAHCNTLEKCLIHCKKV